MRHAALALASDSSGPSPVLPAMATHDPGQPKTFHPQRAKDPLAKGPGFGAKLPSQAGVFPLGVRLGKVRVIVLQHLILVAMPQLAIKGVVSRAAIGVESVVFYCALAHRFIGASRGVDHACSPVLRLTFIGWR